MISERDRQQDRQILENAQRIARNEEAIRRQTEALEKIRDHYYPPPKGFWKKAIAFSTKVVCVIVAYLGIAETVDWILEVRQSEALAANYAEVAHRIFYEEGNAAGAVQCYEKALTLDSDKAEYLTALTLMRGMALTSELMGEGRPLTDEERTRLDLTVADVAMMLSSDSSDPMPHILLAQTLLLKGDKAAAIAEADRAVECAPDNAQVRVSACAISFFAGQIELSKRHLAVAEKLNPDLPLVSCWQGVHSLSVDRDATAAKRHFLTLTKRCPRLALGHAMLGTALMAAAKPEISAARESFQRALTLNAKLSMAILGMSETYEREGKLPVARLWLDRAIANDANGLKAIVARARVNGKLGDSEKAISDLTSAIAIDSFNADLYRLRADFYQKVGVAGKAQADRAMAEALRK